MRRTLLLAALLVASCGEPQRQEPAATEPQEPRPAEQAAAPPRAKATPSPAPPVGEEGQGAADVLRSYYGLIEAGRYDEAFRLREPGKRGPTPEQFRQSFARYAEHRATVGTPSQVAGAAGSLYVEVPVQIYGRLRSGKPFSTAGTVTLRRRSAGGEWRIYTDD